MMQRWVRAARRWRWRRRAPVAAMLARACDAKPFPIQSFMTSGDRLTGRLQEQGGKGLFTKELDEALLDGRIDAAVHSMKDLPTRMPHGIVLACVPAREDPRDAFIALKAKTLADLPAGRGDRHGQPAAPGPDAASAARPESGIAARPGGNAAGRRSKAAPSTPPIWRWRA